MHLSTYLGYMFNSNVQDDEDMLRQMRKLHIRSNKLLHTFHYCSTDVKLELLNFTVIKSAIAMQHQCDAR